MAKINPVTPADLRILMDAHADLLPQFAELDGTAGPWNVRATEILMGSPELLRHLAAIGRGLPVEELSLGAFGNMIAAIACLSATGASPHGPELIQVFVEKMGLGAVSTHPVLRLVVSNDQ